MVKRKMEQEKKTVVHTVNRTNQVAYRFLRQTQKAIVHLNALGFTVLNIDFTRIKPRIEVDVSLNPHIAKALIDQNKAVRYARGKSEDLGIWNGYYTIMEGIRVCWASSVERI